MRRKDRQITDEIKIKQIIDNCDCVRLGFSSENGAYIVPLNFGYLENNDEKILYFHGAKVGRKIDLINELGVAGFEMDTNHTLITAKEACDFSFKYASIIGNGKVSVIEDTTEKIMALNVIMKKYGDGEYTYPEKMLNATAVIKLVINELECKEHI